MSHQLDPKKISLILNQSALSLNSTTLSALQQSRAKALQKQATPSLLLQLAHGRWTSLLIPHTLNQWLIVGLLTLTLSGAGAIWEHHYHQQIIDDDIAILTDELPIEVFLD